MEEFPGTPALAGGVGLLLRKDHSFLPGSEAGEQVWHRLALSLGLLLSVPMEVGLEVSSLSWDSLGPGCSAELSCRALGLQFCGSE